MFVLKSCFSLCLDTDLPLIPLSSIKSVWTGALLLLNITLEISLPSWWPGLCCQKKTMPAPHTGLLGFFWGECVYLLLSLGVRDLIMTWQKKTLIKKLNRKSTLLKCTGKLKAAAVPCAGPLWFKSQHTCPAGWWRWPGQPAAFPA